MASQWRAGNIHRDSIVFDIRRSKRAAAAAAAAATVLVSKCSSHASGSPSMRPSAYRRGQVTIGSTWGSYQLALRGLHRPTPLQECRHSCGSGVVPASSNNEVPAREGTVFTVGVLIILFISCLNLLGYTVLAPLTPNMVARFSLQSEASIGLMASAFGVGRLCAASVWPALSDHIGTKRVLSVALAGSMFGILGQAVAILLGVPFSTFLLARVLTGIFSGIVPVMKAYIVRSFPAKDVPRVLAYREAAGTVAFVLGPVIGGAFAKLSLSLPLFFAAGACGTAAALVARYLDDPQDSSKAVKRGKAAKGSRSDFWHTFGMPLPALFLSFAWACTRTCFHTYYPWMLARQHVLTTVQIGSILTCLSLFMGVVQLSAFQLCVDRLGLRGTIFGGCLLVSIGLLGLSAPTMPAFLAFSAIYGIGGALLSPAAPALLVRLVPEELCGTLLGLDSAVTNFGRIVAPPIFGLWYGTGALNAAAMAMVLAVVPAVLVGVNWRRWLLARMRRTYLAAASLRARYIS